MWKVLDKRGCYQVYKKGIGYGSELSPWGKFIIKHQGLTGAYSTPYRIEAQQIADELNKEGK